MACNNSGGGAYSSPLKLGPAPKKARRSTDLSKCIVCQRNSKESLSVAGEKGLTTLTNASSVMKDDVFKILHEDPRPIPGKVHYHRSCYASYTSKTNLSHKTSQSCKQPESGNESRSTRSAANNTNWQMCVVCQQRKHGSDWKLHKLQTYNAEEGLKQAARERNDEAMKRRIEVEDLIARDAVYHVSCLASYKNIRSIQAASKTSYENKYESEYDTAFQKLISEVHIDLIENKKAFTLYSLLIRLEGHLPDHFNLDTNRSERLKYKLLDHYKDEIEIHSQYGQSKSSFVLSSKISIADALKAASKLKEQLTSPEHTSLFEDNETKSEMITLHRAAGILRRMIDDVPDLKEKAYPSSTGVSLEASLMFVPKKMKMMMMWIIDKKAYDAVEDDFTASEETLRRSVSLAECLIFSSKKVITPLHLGLAAQLHHEYGKREIIDNLHSLGFTVSYDELRRFITSLAISELKKTENYTPLVSFQVMQVVCLYKKQLIMWT
jgi:hypothetical protein